MKLDLTDLTGHIGKHYVYEVNEPPFEGGETGLKCTTPITGKIDFRNSGRHLVVRGDVTTKVELECGRCMGSLEIPMKVSLDDEYEIANIQAILAGQDDEVEEEEPEDETLLQDGIFDLSEFLRQTIIVSLPIAPLCDEACLGLCPTCGTNLNEGPCSCPVEVEASPFSALRDLLDDSKKESGG